MVEVIKEGCGRHGWSAFGMVCELWVNNKAYMSMEQEEDFGVYMISL